MINPDATRALATAFVHVTVSVGIVVWVVLFAAGLWAWWKEGRGK